MVHDFITQPSMFLFSSLLRAMQKKSVNSHVDSDMESIMQLSCEYVSRRFERGQIKHLQRI
jgi:hypothetical protein